MRPLQASDWDVPACPVGYARSDAGLCAPRAPHADRSGTVAWPSCASKVPDPVDSATSAATWAHRLRVRLQWLRVERALLVHAVQKPQPLPQHLLAQQSEWRHVGSAGLVTSIGDYAMSVHAPA
jgi:hypothetical protein